MHARLDALGLRVPVLYLIDRDRTHYPADIAIIEDFPGENLEERFANDPRAAKPTMDRFREALEVMRVYRAPTYGKIAHIDRGGTPRGSSCEGVVLEFALRCVFQAAQAVKSPLIGIGGIATVDDVMEFIVAGASAVQLGTVNFYNPTVSMSVLDALPTAIASLGAKSVTEVVGSLQLKRN